MDSTNRAISITKTTNCFALSGNAIMRESRPSSTEASMKWPSTRPFWPPT